MKARLIPLGLAACLALALAACGGETSAGVPPSESVPATETAADGTGAPAPSDTAAPEPSQEGETPTAPEAPSEAPDPDAPIYDPPGEAPSAPAEPSSIPDKGTPPPDRDSPSPAATPSPSSTPAATPSPSFTPAATPSPTPELSEAPVEEPPEEPQDLSAAQVYAAVSERAGVNYDDVTAYVDAYYPDLDTGDLADYVFYQPSMSGQIEEILIAKVNSGRMEGVKSACLSRQRGMAEDAEMYPGTGTYVSSYQLAAEGDWLIFCVGANAAEAVAAFQNAVQ